MHLFRKQAHTHIVLFLFVTGNEDSELGGVSHFFCSFHQTVYVGFLYILAVPFSNVHTFMSRWQSMGKPCVNIVCHGSALQYKKLYIYIRIAIRQRKSSSPQEWNVQPLAQKPSTVNHCIINRYVFMNFMQQGSACRLVKRFHFTRDIDVNWFNAAPVSCVMTWSLHCFTD